MAINPIDSANLIFEEALGSLMAHTLRGITNHFRKELIELDILVRPDAYGIIPLRAPKEGTTSIIMTKFVPKRTKTDLNRLYAAIFIHKDANHHLARVCIAHEVYHLLLELDVFLENEKRDTWPEIENDKAVEDMCNHFAWELCHQHDQFNRNDGEREKRILFPDNTFNQPFNMKDSTEWFSRWPNGFALDSEKPFWKP
jgi:hypothetical protein